jgi:hypothetical protein
VKKGKEEEMIFEMNVTGRRLPGTDDETDSFRKRHCQQAVLRITDSSGAMLMMSRKAEALGEDLSFIL